MAATAVRPNVGTQDEWSMPAWLPPAGLSEAVTGAVVCADPGTRPRVTADPGTRARVSATCGTRPRVTGTPGLREC